MYTKETAIKEIEAIKIKIENTSDPCAVYALTRRIKLLERRIQNLPK